MKKVLLFAAAAMVAVSASAATENVIAEMYPGSAGLIGWGGEATREVVTEDGREALKITNPTETTNVWDAQFAYDTDFVPGTTYYITFDVKGDVGTISSGFQNKTSYAGCGNCTSFDITGEWNTVTISGKAEANGNDMPDRWVASIGHYVGTFYISNMKFYTLEEGGETPDDPVTPADGWASIIEGGVAADGTTPSIQAGWSGDAQVVANPDGEGVVYEAPIAADPANAWDSQLFIVFDEALEAGETIKVSFDYFCSDERTIETQAQGAPGQYHHYQFIGVLEAGPFWKHHEYEGEITADQAGSDGCKTIAFNLASAPAAATFYVNNVVVEKKVADDPSAVEEIAPAVENGRIVVYNLLGVKVLDTDDATQLNTLRKGIYIVNGKKVAL